MAETTKTFLSIVVKMHLETGLVSFLTLELLICTSYRGWKTHSLYMRKLGRANPKNPSGTDLATFTTQQK